MKLWLGPGAGRALLTMGAVLLSPGISHAQGALTLTEVLASSQAKFPAIRRSLAQREARSGSLEAARGAFDLQLSAESSSRASGFYDGNVLRGKAKQQLRSLGASLYSEYRISEGDFPVYEDESFTNTGGTLKAGLNLPLLRDRAIDPARFGEIDGSLSLLAADYSLLLTQVQVQRNAAIAYWTWVAKGRQLTVYEDLLKLAYERQTALQAQIERGALAPIYLTENRQNLLRRQSFVETARRDFITAGNDLSFYLRTADGEPRPVSETVLPAYRPLEHFAAPNLEADVTWERIREQRPELLLQTLAVERLQQKLQLRRNALLPELDLKLEVADGLGAVAEGGNSRDTTDTIIGMSFSVPLQLREARGRVREGEAELQAALLSLQQTEDQLRLDLRNILQDLHAAERLYDLAAEEVEQAQKLRIAEVRRFESGASDFFVVNLREETAANAQVRYHDAAMRARTARTHYDAATVNLSELGLSAASLTRPN